MAKYLHYMGEFLSREGVTWRAEIMEESDTAFTNVGSLTFEADEALVIEWDEKSKEKVLCGSTATLQIESPGDRTYIDLYSIKTGQIRLDVYRNNVLYWSGALDPEFYEEPYESKDHYIVSLTFSDFGILGRLKYDLAGMQTIEQIINYCLNRSTLLTSVDETLISTQLSATASAMKLADLKVRSDNFYDEDGEASTLEEVIEAILQPLALRMIQRNGKVYIYDLNGLYTKAAAKDIEWNGDSSAMGVDAVYNNAKITWSTYAQSGNLSPETCWTDPTDAQMIAINMLAGRQSGSSLLFSYHYAQNLDQWADATDSGFTLWLSKNGANATLNNDNIRFFKIVPQYDGQESEGIALFWQGVRGYRVGGSGWSQAQMQWQGYGVSALPGNASMAKTSLYKTSPVWVPPVDNASALLMRVSMDVLMETRFNPFEQAVNWMKNLEQKDWQDQFNARGNFVYIPVLIKFEPENSADVYVWTNQSIVKQDVKNNPVTTLWGTYGSWVKYNGNADAPNAWGYLCYYQPDDRAEKAGVASGWAKNRPCINPHTKDLISILKNAETGQFIPYPTYGGGGGKISIEVLGAGWMINDGNDNIHTTDVSNPYSLWGKISWVLCKLPEIEPINNAQFDATISTDDIEYKAEINAAAKEAVEIDTMCGTANNGVPTARGAYFDAAAGSQIKTLTRAGRTTQAEELLIGTLYSQFADRRTKLSGEMEILADGVVSYKEQNQDGKLFIVTADTQNLITDTSDATIVELRPDEYEKEV